MTDQITRTVPAGWYEDENDGELVRWWNGLGWTEHVRPKPTSVGTDPAQSVEVTQGDHATAPGGTETASSDSASAAHVATEKPASVGLGFQGGHYARAYEAGDD